MDLFKKRRNPSSNPYLPGQIGRREWNDRYDNLAQGRRHWQWAFLIVVVLALIQAIYMGRMALRSSIQPFVVETNQGMPYAMQTASTVSTQDPRLVNYALNQFIMNVRSVIHDTSAQKSLLNKAYAFAAGSSKPFLRDYYTQHDPFKSAVEYTIAVQIINSLPLGKNTWQITWDETKQDLLGGKIIEKTRWLAQLHYEFGPVNPHFVTDNPFGIYVTDLTWSESQTHD